MTQTIKNTLWFPKSDRNNSKHIAPFIKVTQTIQNTSLDLWKWRKQFKTPRSLYKSDVNNWKHLALSIKLTQTIKNTLWLSKSDVNNSGHLARFIKVTKTTENTSFALWKWRNKHKTPRSLYKIDANDWKHSVAL